MRDNVALSDKQMKFVRLVAAGEHSVTECHVLAGYGRNGKRDSANAQKLKKHLAAHIAAERERLGIRDEPEASPDVDDADKAELIAAQRKLYADAVASGNLAVQRAALRSLERLMKRPGTPGRPSTQAAPASKPATAHVPVDWQAVYDFVFTREENAEYEREVAAGPEIERQRELWLSGEPNNNYIELAYPRAKTRTLADGSTYADLEEPSVGILELEEPEPTLASELRSSTSHVALEAGEKVRRL